MNNSTELSRTEKKELFLARVEEGKTDPIVFTNRFLYTFDPRVKENPHIPFVLFDYQRKLVVDVCDAIVNGYDIFVDKSRDVGATYTILAVFMHFWLYDPGSNFLVGSRKQDYVDNRFGLANPDDISNKEESLFGKLDYMVSKLPSFMLPDGFNMKKHMGFMKMMNPENGNVISGESSNSNFSRGGRQRAILLDEFAFWDNDVTAWGATADTTNCRIVLTTAGIKPSKAKRLRFGKDGEEIKVIEIDFTQDPRKNKKWELKERGRRSKEDFAREIMRNWETSLKGRVYNDIIEVEVGLFPYNHLWPLYVSWDFGLDGTAIQWWQVDPITGRKRLVESYDKKDQPIQFFFPFFDNPIDSTFDYETYDLEVIKRVKKFKKAIHYGDPDVAKRAYQSKKKASTREELESVKIYVQTDTKANDFFTRWEKTKVMLRSGVDINDTTGTQYWLEAMQEARFPQRPDNSQVTTGISKPIHDWSSHQRTATEFFAVNYKGEVKKEESATETPIKLDPYA